MKKIIFYFLLVAFSFTQEEVFSGYLRINEASFCMDECARYSIESEIDSGFGSLHVVFNDDMEVDFYLNRFVEVRVSDEEVNCIECSALQVLELNLSDDCDYPVNCFVDPCDVAEECQLNTPVDCVSNYCGGCYADFYDLENNLVDCYLDEGELNPCSDFGQEDCEWFDECIWTDNSCQDFDWENNCNGLTQDECVTNEGCEWISDSDNPNNWGMCVEADNEGGPPECLMDCEGIEYINPDENPYEACDWIISNFGPNNFFNQCAEDCNDETLEEINELVEACYNCLEDTTLDCSDVFDDNDFECADLNYEECVDSEGCNPNFNSTGEFEGCIDSNNNDWECSDIENPYECNANEDCEWQPNPTGSGQCIEGDDFEPVCEDLSDIFFGWCDMIIGIGWNGEECTWYSGCDTIGENGIDYSSALFDSIEECEAVCSDNENSGYLYGTVEYIWGDAIEMVAGALIQITSGNGMHATETNEQGFYEIELPQGQYSVSVEAYGEYQVQDVYVMENHEHQLNFTFGEFYYETALAGHVYCEGCANGFIPIIEARVLITNPNNWFSIETFTNEDGFFWANVPASGMYNVSISSDGYIDFDDYIFIQGITDWEFYLDTDNSGGDGYAMLSLENIVASPGSEVSIPLLLESDLAVAGVQFSVYTLGEGFPNYISGFELNSMNDCFTASSNSVGGAFIGIIFSLEGCTYLPDETNHIADLIYEVSNNVPPGLELFLEFESTLVSDTEGNEILSYGEGATILFGLQGDVNSDGSINILDIVLIVNFAIYIEEPTDSQFWASDINGDGLINILDIVQVVNLILNN